MVIGSYVRTVTGPRFEGEIRSTFETKNGKSRAVVEALHQDFEETLHIFPVEQLELVKTAPWQPLT